MADPQGNGEKRVMEKEEGEEIGAPVASGPSIPSENFLDSFKTAAFVIAGGLIVFVAARNTIIWY